MTPEAAKQLSDLFVGMTIAFVIAIIICWYFVPSMFAGLSTVFEHPTKNTEPGTKKTGPTTLRRNALRVAEHRYRVERISQKRRGDGKRDGRTEAGRTPDAHDITKLRAAIEAEVWQQVRAITKERQRKSLDTYLVENWQRVDSKGKMKPVRREDIYGLMGQRDDDVRAMIEELEEDRRLRSIPRDPQLETMEPIPT